MRVVITVLALLGVVFAGCAEEPVSPNQDTDQDGVPDILEEELGTDPLAPDQPRVVVAIIDTGTNPYHNHFQIPGGVPNATLDSISNSIDGKMPERVQLTRAQNFDDSFAADNDTWNGMQNQTLYYFAGTNILGIHFGIIPEDGSNRPILDDAPGEGHGTQVSGAVIDANPNAIVVAVSGNTSAGEEWVASQAWIDVMSMSYGPLGSIPINQVFEASTPINTKAAWDAGIMPFGAADNSPATATQDTTAGPPWVIGLAGDHPEVQCREGSSGNVPDFTADFTQNLPDERTLDAYNFTSGTSFATPTSAGVASAAILEVRKAWGHSSGIVDGAMAIASDGSQITNADVRAALNRTAVYFTESEPGCGAGDDGTSTFGASTRQPVNPDSPWQQMGWGHLGPEVIKPTADFILGIAEPAEKPAEAREHQQRAYDARAAYWNDN